MGSRFLLWDSLWGCYPWAYPWVPIFSSCPQNMLRRGLLFAKFSCYRGWFLPISWKQSLEEFDCCATTNFRKWRRKQSHPYKSCDLHLLLLLSKIINGIESWGRMNEIQWRRFLEFQEKYIYWRIVLICIDMCFFPL